MGNTQVKQNEKESSPILLEEVTDGPNTGESRFPLHKAAYLGNVTKAKELISILKDKNIPFPARQLDNFKMTPLHHAAMSGNLEVAKLLMNEDELHLHEVHLLFIQDVNKQTPLHHALQNRSMHTLALVNYFLDKGADPNIKNSDGFSALHIAGSTSAPVAIEYIDRILQCPNVKADETGGPHNRTLLHVAMSTKGVSPDKIRYLLGKGYNPSQVDAKGFNALHIAAGAGDTPKCVENLNILLEAMNTTDELNAKTKEHKRTALHIAAYNSYENIIVALLANQNVDIWAKDATGRTALHWAADAWFRPTAHNCVKLLIESDKLATDTDRGKFIHGMRDNKGENALQIAVVHKSLKITDTLITAHSEPKLWLIDDTLQQIYSHLPEALIPLMDEAITYNPATFHERNEAIDCDFGTITGYKDPVLIEQQETKYIHKILYTSKEIQSKVLLHPLVEIFIDKKWDKIKWLTFGSIFFQFAWIILYTILVYEVYAPNCPDGDDNKGTDMKIQANETTKSKTLRILLSIAFSKPNASSLADCDFNEAGAFVLTMILYAMSVVFLLKEIFQMTKNHHYFWDLSNWGQLILLVTFGINTIPVFQSDPTMEKWQYHLAAFGIFLAWILSLREVGKMPKCGIYAAILKKVFWHCLKMILFYLPLFAAFALCLGILVPGKGQYKYVLFAIIKVVIMMTGELDFEDAFYDEETGPHLALNAIFGQFVFLLLVFATTIVLLNLLTGLAVNDVQSLIEEAEVNRLANELEQIFFLETVLLWMRRSLCKGEIFKDWLLRHNVTCVRDFFSAVLVGIETSSFPAKLRDTIRKKAIPYEASN